MIEQEFKVIIRFPDEKRGRAYIRTQFHEVNGTRLPKKILRQRPGLGSAPTWVKNDAEELASVLRATFPQTTVTVKRAA
jgi:hypothetical protein